MSGMQAVPLTLSLSKGRPERVEGRAAVGTEVAYTCPACAVCAGGPRSAHARGGASPGAWPAAARLGWQSRGTHSSETREMRPLRGVVRGVERRPGVWAAAMRSAGSSAARTPPRLAECAHCGARCAVSSVAGAPGLQLRGSAGTRAERTSETCGMRPPAAEAWGRASRRRLLAALAACAPDQQHSRNAPAAAPAATAERTSRGALRDAAIQASCHACSRPNWPIGRLGVLSAIGAPIRRASTGLSVNLGLLAISAWRSGGLPRVFQAELANRQAGRAVRNQLGHQAREQRA
jgi:hypothetical protein